MSAKSLQSCLILWDPVNGSLPGSPVPGILQARTLEWVAISFSNAWKWKVEVKALSRVRLFETPWTAAHRAPPSVGFSRQEHWRGAIALSLSRITRGWEGWTYSCQHSAGHSRVVPQQHPGGCGWKEAFLVHPWWCGAWEKQANGRHGGNPRCSPDSLFCVDSVILLVWRIANKGNN